MLRFTAVYLLLFLCALPAWALAQTVAKPDILLVEDYKGPDGNGDQGGFVLVTFKHTPQHAQLTQYRIWREILISTAYAPATGRITVLTTPQLRWVPWVAVEVKPLDKGDPPLTWAIVPTLDNVATRWAITAEIGGRTPIRLDEEYVKESLALLGIQSAVRLSDVDELMPPAYEFAKALLGERDYRLIGQLDLDGLRQIALRVPGAASNIASSSDATLAASAVRAIDNIPPATVTDLKATNEGRKVTLTWSASRDDRLVGFIPYRGWAVTIPGINAYDIYRGTDEGRMVRVAHQASGSTFFKDVVSDDLGERVVYRVTSTDLDNATPSPFVVVELGRDKTFGVAAIELEKTKTPPAPADFALHQNYPNPFNPATTIKYDLAEDGRVKLVVYSKLGQVVRTLVKGPQAAGRYSVPWDGKDERGLRVASGIYFYRLTTEKFESVKKLTLVK